MNDSLSTATQPQPVNESAETVPTPNELLAIAERIARTAAELVTTRRAEGVTVAATKSTDVDIVTAVDRESEDLIRSLIRDARPDDGFFGEESGAADLGTSGLTWVVDPIDGTVNFLYGVPSYAVSIAVVSGPPTPEEWVPLAGVVVDVVRGDVFTATAGGGAAKNGAPIAVNAGVPAARALVGTGFGYSADRRVWQADVLTQIIARVRDIRRLGAAALDLCFVADGRLDAYYERGLQPWDHAAGALIASEAGAVVRGHDGRAPSSEFVIAAAPELFDELHALLAGAGAFTDPV